MSKADENSGQAGPEAFALYSDWLGHPRESRPGFEEFCARHSLVRDQLRALHALANLAQPAGPHRTFRDLFGEDAEIALTLPEEAAPADPAQPGPLHIDLAFGSSRYALQGEVGRGGMGVIYKVRDRELNRVLAMKVMLGASPVEPEKGPQTLRGRFLEEVQVTAQLDHPGIVAVHELGLDTAGRPYFTMKLVKGRDLGCIFDLARSEREDWNLPRAVGAVVKACQAVAFAHSKGVIHRDLKPPNVMVGRFGEVYVMDWGLAKVVGRRDLHDLRVTPVPPRTITEIRTPRGGGGSTTADSPLITMDGSVVGTPSYMPPEQAKGQVEQVDALSDVYSLGAILYNLLTGQAPYAEPGARLSPHTILARVIDGPPKRILVLNPKAPAELVAVCEKAMARDKAGRYPSSLDVAEDLQAWLDRRVVRAYRTGAVAEFKAWVLRNQSAALAGAAALVILIVALATVLVENQQIARARRGAEQNLYDSLVREARATRINRREGYREHVFRLIKQAHALHVPDRDAAELRSEIAGCLGDFVGVKPAVFSDFPTNTTLRLAQIDPGSRLVAVALPEVHAIQIRELSSGKEMASFRTEQRPWSIAFDVSGDHLISVQAQEAATVQEQLAGSLVQVWRHETNDTWQPLEKEKMPGACQCLSSQKGVSIVLADLAAHSLQVVDLQTRKVLHTSALPGAMNRPLLAALSPERNLLVLETVDPSVDAGAFDIWDLATDKLIRRIEPHLSGGRSVSFSPDGKSLALLCEGGVSIYSTDGFERLAVYRDTFDSVDHVSFASGASILALPSRGLRRVRLWDWIKNEDRARLDELTEVVETVFSPNGKFLLTSTGQELRLYTLERPAEKLSLDGHTGGIPGVSFSPNGATLASVGKDKTLRIWDTGIGQLAGPVQRLSGEGQFVTYLSSGRFVATTTWNTELVQIWDSTGQQLVRQLGIDAPGVGWSAQFSRDERYMVTASSWGTHTGVRIWDLGVSPEGANAQPVRTLVRFFPGQTASLVFAPVGSRFAFVDRISSSEGRLYLWDWNDPGPPRFLGTCAPDFSAQNLSFAPDGRMLMTLGPGRRVITLDVATGKQVNSFPTIDNPGGVEKVGTSVCLSPDGARLALSSPASLGVGLWEPRSGKLLYGLPEQSGAVWWVAWSPDGQQLAVARSNGDLTIWKLAEIDRILAALDLKP